jgi:hypothetical protein
LSWLALGTLACAALLLVDVSSAVFYSWILSDFASQFADALSFIGIGFYLVDLLIIAGVFLLAPRPFGQKAIALIPAAALVIFQAVYPNILAALLAGELLQASVQFGPIQILWSALIPNIIISGLAVTYWLMLRGRSAKAYVALVGLVVFAVIGNVVNSLASWVLSDVLHLSYNPSYQILSALLVVIVPIAAAAWLGHFLDKPTDRQTIQSQ